MKLITDRKEIERLHNKLVSSLNQYKTEDIRVLTGHMGESLHVDASYSEELNIWWNIDIVEGNSGERYWNAFGIGKPKPNKLAYIICEINYPTSGINKRVAATWVKEAGEYVLLHSGKIGGGRKGIGKISFQEKFAGSFVESPLEELSGKYTEIGNLNNPNLPHQIKFFVEEVARIKDEIVNPTSSVAKNSIDPLEILKTTYNEEFTGTKQYNGNSNKITSNCNHGLVVNGLKEALEDKQYKIANDQARDLYIYNETPQITHVFEIKTSLNSQIIFTAIGQLLVNSARIEPLPKLVFVVPEKLNINLTKTLQKLNITQLVYTFKNNKPIFKDIETKL